MNDKELVNFVLRFAGEMNALQRKYGRFSLEQGGPEANAALTAFQLEAKALYSRYLTPRKRNYHTALSVPPTYAAVEGLTLSTVERKKNRALVELLTSVGQLDFQFNLFCKDGEWRINSFRQRVRNKHRVYRWVYGDF